MHESIQLSKEMVKILTTTCSTFPEIEQVILFGSRAKGCATERSDIDLVLKGTEVTRFTVGKVKALFEESDLPVSVDVLAFQLIKNEELIDHITRVGKILYSKE